MSSIEKVIAKWRADGVELLTPSDEAQIVAVISSSGQRLSRDVAELYHATGGMPDGVMDALCFSLWPLDRVTAENQRHQDAGVLFADFLIDSHVYLFRYGNAETSSVHVEYGDGKGPQRLADSVSEFFELYLDNSEKIGL
ncbi:MAG: hypothetical protein H0U18_10990 [Pyrinomonadaceae bacterium]|jgi:hypothetical protein|nr:hypothetical protein [Pyrinomonadaceae bacterium]